VAGCAFEHARLFLFPNLLFPGRMKHMRIGIDASFLRKPGTGIGQITVNFLKKLAEFSGQGGLRRSWQFLSGLHEAEIILYTEEETNMKFPEQFHVKHFLPTWWKRDDIVRKLLWERQVVHEAMKDRCDVFISLYQSATVFPPSQMHQTQYGDFHHTMVVHDIIPKLFPEYLKKITQKIHWKAIERGIRNAGHIITISESTKKDLMVSLDILEEKITVTYPGLSAVFDTICSDERLEVVLKKYDLERGYVYHGGGFEVRKNVEKLLRAYKQLTINSQQGITLPLLVISGKIHAKGNPLATDVEGLVSELGLMDRVRVLGFVPEEDLPALYRGAAVFVYPSLYEGLGLPPIEAMSQGTPCIVSNTSSLPEACGDAALYVNPTDTAELTEKMSLLLSDPNLHEELRQKGFEQVKKFSWKFFVRRVME
jgi:glycosyltransferase involved in cell wall biosynthesis